MPWSSIRPFIFIFDREFLSLSWTSCGQRMQLLSMTWKTFERPLSMRVLWSGEYVSPSRLTLNTVPLPASIQCVVFFQIFNSFLPLAIAVLNGTMEELHHEMLNVFLAKEAVEFALHHLLQLWSTNEKSVNTKLTLVLNLGVMYLLVLCKILLVRLAGSTNEKSVNTKLTLVLNWG